MERMGLAGDRPTCEEDVSNLLRPLAEALNAAVTSGRASYDGAALARCLEAVKTSACPQARTWEVLALTTKCAFVTPRVASGGVCRASFECVGGHCDGGDETKDGRCVSPRKADGQPCDRGDDCASSACHPALDVCAPPQPGNICD
jgi:hypothetical protein